jgi:hypothetical protein
MTVAVLPAGSVTLAIVTVGTPALGQSYISPESAR